MDTNRYDLIVAGGGPAGTTAAITAARLGARVLLLERGRFPRHKVCGEFVSGEAFTLLGNLLAEQEILLTDSQKTTEARLFIGSSVTRFPISPAASISRYELDAALWRTAENEGVDCRQTVAVDRLTHRSETFVATTTIGLFTARAAIDATGRWSKLRPGVVTNNKEPQWIGLKAHFRVGTASDGCGTTDLYFFDRGYCGIQPLGDTELNVCAMVRSDAATKLEDVFKLHPDLRKRSRTWLQVTDVVATAPLVFHAQRPECDGIVRVGDAAAFIDPFVGDGISMALRSGVLASNTLQFVWSKEMRLDNAVRHYRYEYRRCFARPLRTAAWLRKLLAQNIQHVRNVMTGL